jgi:hypothetical protein
MEGNFQKLSSSNRVVIQFWKFAELPFEGQ